MVALRGLSSGLAGILIASSLSGAATITVDLWGGADFTEIWPAMEAAGDGDTVLVRPGEYIINVPIDFRGKAIQLRSQSGPERTTIRMHRNPYDVARASVVVFQNGEGPASILDGFTLTGGRSCGNNYGSGGGGILCARLIAQGVLQLLLRLSAGRR